MKLIKRGGALLSVVLGGLVLASSVHATTQPNVLVVMTDDQPYGSQAQMPWLTAHAGEFTTFTQAHNNNALCCPARATFLTGLYSHHTGVEVNNGKAFDPTTTLATEFDAAGYETGLFGKYLNGYPFGRSNSYIPPGWDSWSAFTGGFGGPFYYDYKLNVDGAVEGIGHAPQDYSTDLLAGHVREFIAGAEDPFFALYVPYGPHRDYTAAPRHQGVHDATPWAPPGNFNKRDPQTHPWWRALETRRRESVRANAREQMDSLLSIDEALGGFYVELDAQGELDDTIIVFLTDNGFSLGSHRWVGKRCAFEECEHIPLMIRAPEATVATTNALVSNIDLAPTIADLAGIPYGGTFDGESLVPLMNGQATTLNRPALLRVKRDRSGNEDPPSMWGLRTDRWKYMRWRGGQQDLYDLQADPDELKDLAGRRKYRDIRNDLEAQMSAIREAP